MTDDTRLRLVEQYRLAIGIPDAPCADMNKVQLASKIVGFALNAFGREIAVAPHLNPWLNAEWREAFSIICNLANERSNHLDMPVVEQVALDAGIPVENLKQGLSRCPHDVAAVLGYDSRPSRLELGEDTELSELDEAGALEYVAGEVRKLSADLNHLPAGLQHVAWGVLAAMASYMRDDRS